jgi:hypothetical protein
VSGGRRSALALPPGGRIDAAHGVGSALEILGWAARGRVSSLPIVGTRNTGGARACGPRLRPIHLSPVPPRDRSREGEASTLKPHHIFLVID